MPIDEKERARRRRLAKQHIDAENAHDLDAIVASFASDAMNVVNNDVSTTSEGIRQQHALFGLGPEPGILSDLRVIPEHEHFTDEEIVHEGRFRGVHTGSAKGFPPPSGESIDLPYIVVYRFDANDKLVSERATIDMSPLTRALFPIGSTP